MAFSFYEKCAKEIEKLIKNNIIFYPGCGRRSDEFNDFSPVLKKDMNIYKFHSHLYEEMFNLGISNKDFEKLVLEALDVVKMSGCNELYTCYLNYFLFEMNYKKGDSEKVISFGEDFLYLYHDKKDVAYDCYIFKNISDLLWHFDNIEKVEKIYKNCKNK